MSEAGFLCATMFHERLQRGVIPCNLPHVFLRVDMTLSPRLQITLPYPSHWAYCTLCILAPLSQMAIPSAITHRGSILHVLSNSGLDLMPYSTDYTVVLRHVYKYDY